MDLPKTGAETVKIVDSCLEVILSNKRSANPSNSIMMCENSTPPFSFIDLGVQGLTLSRVDLIFDYSG